MFQWLLYNHFKPVDELEEEEPGEDNEPKKDEELEGNEFHEEEYEEDWDDDPKYDPDED